MVRDGLMLLPDCVTANDIIAVIYAVTAAWCMREVAILNIYHSLLTTLLYFVSERKINKIHK